MLFSSIFLLHYGLFFLDFCFSLRWLLMFFLLRVFFSFDLIACLVMLLSDNLFNLFFLLRLFVQHLFRYLFLHSFNLLLSDSLGFRLCVYLLSLRKSFNTLRHFCTVLFRVLVNWLTYVGLLFCWRCNL